LKIGLKQLGTGQDMQIVNDSTSAEIEEIQFRFPNAPYDLLFLLGKFNGWTPE
jgi:hypothetical protein